MAEHREASSSPVGLDELLRSEGDDPEQQQPEAEQQAELAALHLPGHYVCTDIGGLPVTLQVEVAEGGQERYQCSSAVAELDLINRRLLTSAPTARGVHQIVRIRAQGYELGFTERARRETILAAWSPGCTCHVNTKGRLYAPSEQERRMILGCRMVCVIPKMTCPYHNMNVDRVCLPGDMPGAETMRGPFFILPTSTTATVVRRLLEDGDDLNPLAFGDIAQLGRRLEGDLDISQFFHFLGDGIKHAHDVLLDSPLGMSLLIGRSPVLGLKGRLWTTQTLALAERELRKGCSNVGHNIYRVPLD